MYKNKQIKLNDYIIIENKIIKISLTKLSNIDNIDKAVHLKNDLEKLFAELVSISDKGYLNSHDLNIPMVLAFLNDIGLVKRPKDFKGSIILNTIYFNLMLLLMYQLIIKLESLMLKMDDKNSDSIVDVKNLKKSVVSMINPCLKNRLQNKGLTVLLNSITGFDSEYELKSSLHKSNELISIQLASNTSFYVKVPLTNREPVSIDDFNIDNKQY